MCNDVPRYLFDLAIGERDRARERIASLMLKEPSKTQGLYAAVDELQAENKRLRTENFALVDAMRDARALLHKPRPRAMAAASILGDALTTRVLEMLPEKGEEDG